MPNWNTRTSVLNQLFIPPTSDTDIPQQSCATKCTPPNSSPAVHTPLCSSRLDTLCHKWATHVFESVLAAFVTIKAAALETTSKLHVLLASHYFSPPFASSSTSPKENLLRSFWTSAIGQKPLSVGEFFQANSVSPNAPVCYRRVIVGSIQDKRVPHPTLGFKCRIHDTTFFRCPRVGSFHI
jgi:hypothetical protein